MAFRTPPEFLRRLRAVLGDEKVSTSPTELVLHDHDVLFGIYKGRVDAVVKPTSVRDVSETLKLCNEYGVPVYTQGALTSLTGASIPQGGIALDMSGMRRILEISLENAYVKAEAGVKLNEINERLAGTGFFFPVDPASVKSATVGGAIATNAGGMRGFRYGPMKNWVLGLKVVLADGSVIRLGGMTLKRRQGYELMNLFIGSEGTLGVIVEATLKITRKPEAIARIVGFFKSYRDLVRAALRVRVEANPLTMEFLDNELARIASEYAGVEIPEEAGFVLLVDVDGPREVLERLLDEVVLIFRSEGAVEIRYSTDPREIEKLYELRRAMYPASLSLRGKVRENVMVEDLVVPPTRLMEVFEGIYSLAEKYGFPVYLGGHIGDGNVHPLILYNSDEMDQMLKMHREMHRLALRLNGGISAEHGIGLVKKELLVEEFKHLGSLRPIEIMRAVKRLLDPKGILNPGKVIDLE